MKTDFGWLDGERVEIRILITTCSNPPRKIYKTVPIWDRSVAWDIQLRWIQMPRVKPRDGKRMKNHPLHIISTHTPAAATAYSSKWMDRGSDAEKLENYFYITPPN